MNNVGSVARAFPEGASTQTGNFIRSGGRIRTDKHCSKRPVMPLKCIPATLQKVGQLLYKKIS